MNFLYGPLKYFFLVLHNSRLPYSVNTVFSICSFLVVQWLFSACVLLSTVLHSLGNSERQISQLHVYEITYIVMLWLEVHCAMGIRQIQLRF